MSLRALRLRIAAILCLIGGAVGSVLGYQAREQERRLQREGIPVPAKVVSRSTLAMGRGRTSHKLVLRYSPSAGEKSRPKETYEKEFSVSASIYVDAQNGTPVTVRYLPADPTVSIVEGNPAGGSEKMAMAVGLLIGGAVLCFFVFGNRFPGGT